jgi:type IV pilus assembly protein PilV
MRPNPDTMSPSVHAQGGMTLVEVLVTLILISVGLLGVAALQLSSLRSNKDAYVRSQASALAGDILDRMRANQYKANEYVAALNGTGTGSAVNDVDTWQKAIDMALPGTDDIRGGSIAVSGNLQTGQVVTITIQWGERGDFDSGVAAQTMRFVTRSEI